MTFSFLFVSSFLLVFCTKVLGINGGVVGTIFMLSKFIDAFTDVGMGRIVDTAKPTKAGKYRPWILRMSFPIAISNALMWMHFIKDWSMTAKNNLYSSNLYSMGKFLLHRNQYTLWFNGFSNKSRSKR